MPNLLNGVLKCENMIKSIWLEKIFFDCGIVLSIQILG